MKTILLSIFLCWSSLALANFKTELKLEWINHSKLNQVAAGVPKSSSCDVFKGTYHGNTVVLKPIASGGSGKYRHRLIWQISESYKTFTGQRTQQEAAVKDGKNYAITLPELRDDVSYIQQSVFLISEDLKTSKTTTSQLLFNVSRPVVLAHTNHPEKLRQNCFQIFPSNESVAGILSNGSTNPGQILIRQGIQNIWTRTNGSQWGFYISPLAWTSVGNIFSVYKSYFTQFSQQTIETVEISSGHQIAPGDFIQLYEQRTRYVTAFDAFEIGACGESREVEGTYFMQWWGVAYHALPVNPYSSDRPPRETIGVSPVNHCPDNLTPEFSKDSGDFIFSRTN